MSAAAEQLLIERDEFLKGELTSHQKHEFVVGQVYAMAGGTVNHDTVAGNFRTEAGYGLKGKKCRPMGSDLLLRVSRGDFGEAFYYPDGMVMCQPMGGRDRFGESPTVILEVLSPSTRLNDEVHKLRDYFTIASLKVYLLAEANEPIIRVYRRSGENFEMSVISGEEAVVSLPEVGLELALSELYRDVEFEDEESP